MECCQNPLHEIEDLSGRAIPLLIEPQPLDYLNLAPKDLSSNFALGIGTKGRMPENLESGRQWAEHQKQYMFSGNKVFPRTWFPIEGTQSDQINGLLNQNGPPRHLQAFQTPIQLTSQQSQALTDDFHPEESAGERRARLELETNQIREKLRATELELARIFVNG